MGIESIQAVQGRIAEIQQRVGGLGAVGSSSASGGIPFAGVLRQAMGSTGNVAPGPAGGASGAPAGLEAFANGLIPEQALTPIAPGERLWAPAAEAYRRLAADAQAAGITFRVTDSYRTYDEQVDIARRKGLYSQGGLGAAPGTSSHGWGLSVDLDTTPETLAWLRSNAGRYGFIEDVPREPWHWTYRAPASRPAQTAFDPAALQRPR